MSFVTTRSEKSYKEAIDRLKPGLWRHISNIEKDNDSINFILTSTFAKMWSEIEKYTPDKAAFSTWIYRVARNEALQHKRYTNRHSSYNELFENGSKTLAANSPLIEPNEFFDENIDYDPTMQLYDKLISTITTLDIDSDKNNVYRDALIMRIVKNQKYSDIAKTLGIPISTAKARVHNGKKLLKRLVVEAEPTLVGDFIKMIN